MAYKQVEIYIIEPKAATNLITNPSFETATTGWTASGAGVSIAVSTAYQRRGAQSCEVTTATGVASGVYYGIALTSGTAYSFSVDVRDVLSQGFRIYFADNTGSVLGTPVTWTGTGNWTRRSVTYTAAASATHRLYVVRDSVASTTKFQIDGAQLEADSAASTYFDGDSVGWHRTRKDYAWNGTPHASTSTRSVMTRSGGSLLRLRDYCNYLGAFGFGMPTYDNSFLPTGRAGSIYQGTRIDNREFQISVQFTGATYDAVLENRAAIENALSSERMPEAQPVVIRWQLEDENGEPVSNALDIQAVYGGGLEHDNTSQFSQSEDKATIRFTGHRPYWKTDGEIAVQLGYATSVTNANYVIMRDTTGTWAAIGTGGNDQIYDVLVSSDGTEYYCGKFTAFDGVAALRMCKRSNGVVTQCGTGLNNDVLYMRERADGKIYLCGTFTATGGAVPVNLVAIYDPATDAITAVGTFPSASASALIMEIDKSGNLWVGSGDGIYKWDGSAWTEIGTLTNVYGLVISTGNEIYVSDNTGTTRYIRKLNTAGTGWDIVYTTAELMPLMAFLQNGDIVFGEQYLGGDTSSTIRKLRGTSSVSLGTVTRTTVGCGFFNVTADRIGNVYMVGFFDKVNGIPVSDAILKVTASGEIIPSMDIDLPGSANVNCVHFDNLGRMFIGFSTSGSATSATVTAPNNTGSKAYPRITFTGPGVCWQVKNYTNGKSLYFANLTLLAGETAVLEWDDDGRIKFTSSFRGNLLSYILQGSDKDWYLSPGSNNVSAYMTGTTAASKTVMTWRPRYQTTDAAVF